MFAASPHLISILHLLSTLITFLGFWIFNFDIKNLFLILLGYFLYSGIGISMTMHRYYSHKSFEFKFKFLKWLCTFFAVVAGRGSTIGWVYVHRNHHKHSDTNRDPHDIKTVGLNILLPHRLKYAEKIDKKIIRDLLTKEHLFINRYYILFLIFWVICLSLISIETLYFFYIVPMFLTFISLSLFVLLSHNFGYQNFKTTDNSKNNWFVSLILWGEGWHNNHHYDSKNFSTQRQWWEIDLLKYCISFCKK